MPHAKFSGMTPALLCVVALVFALGISSLSAGVPSAHAQTRKRAIPAVDSSPCKPARPSTHEVCCSGPSITTFCSGTQYFTAADGFGHPIDWIYLDHHNHCATVTFNLSNACSSCDIDFYVPQGNADALFTYSWVDGSNGSVHTGTLNEAPVDGWQFLFSIATPKSLSFEDLRPGSPTGLQQIGWRANSSDVVRVICV